jgi:hypothetical protein
MVGQQTLDLCILGSTPSPAASMFLLLFVIGLAVVFAKLEIQIEGAHGWAEKLPTWRIKNPLRKIFNWPEITGYHLYLNLFLVLLFHLTFFMGVKFNLSTELQVLETLGLLLMLEDFLWFVLNPSWGIKRFFTEEVPWHKHKVLGLPANYWSGLALLVLLEMVRRWSLSRGG